MPSMTEFGERNEDILSLDGVCVRACCACVFYTLTSKAE